MERADIIRGIKAALDRGYSLEKIINSYIKTGYKKEDVIDSARRVAEELNIELPESVKALIQAPIVKLPPVRVPPAKAPVSKPKLPPRQIQHPKLTPPKPTKPAKPKDYFPEENPPDYLLQILKYAPPETKPSEIPREKIPPATKKPEQVYKKQKLKQELVRLEESRQRKSVTALFIMLIICSALLFVSLILLLIFKTRVIDFLNSLSA